MKSPVSKFLTSKLAFIALVIWLGTNLFAQQVPHTELTTLANAHVIIPINPTVKPLLVMVGFSHKSSEDAAAWNKIYKFRYETDPRLDYYEIADFEGVPSLIMKMILHGMRRSFQEPERSHFASFYEHEQGWKTLAGFDDPKITYLVLADKTGHVVWQIHGPATAAKAARLEKSVARLQAEH